MNKEIENKVELINAVEADGRRLSPAAGLTPLPCHPIRF